MRPARSRWLRSYPMRSLGRDSFIDNFEAHYLEEIERFGAIVMANSISWTIPIASSGCGDILIWRRGSPPFAPSTRAR
jgi:hypothetical protein